MEAESNNYFHGVNYDLNYFQRDVRDLLYHSQTNVTADPQAGFEYAVAAYDKGRTPQLRQIDPTASGEAAAKAGFRAEQADMPSSIVDYWFQNSHVELRADNPRTRRELVATHLLEGRAWGLRLLKDNVADVPTVVARASGAFMKAEHGISQQHEKGERWDAYGTMVARHYGTYEAYFGSSKDAASLALRGIWRALRSEEESANSNSEDLLLLQRALQHGKFVAKQVVSNAAVLGLAVLAPLERFGFGMRLRRKFARQMLG